MSPYLAIGFNTSRMFRKILIVLACLLVLCVATVGSYIYLSVDNRVIANTEIKPLRGSEQVVRLDSVVLQVDSIKRFIFALMKTAKVQGLGVSIINDNKLLFQDYFGSRNVQKKQSFAPGVIWYAASLSKPLFADIVLQLAENKLIHLDTPLYKYLSEPLPSYRTNLFDQLMGSQQIDYRDLAHDARYQKITARMCLSHTTGFPNWRWLEADKKLKIKFEPGSRYAYSGEGMFLLQFVLEELLDKDLEEIANTKEFIPHHMESSSFVWQRAYEGNYVVGHDAASNDLRIPKSNTSSGPGSLSQPSRNTLYFSRRCLRKMNNVIGIC